MGVLALAAAAEVAASSTLSGFSSVSRDSLPVLALPESPVSAGAGVASSLGVLAEAGAEAAWLAAESVVLVAAAGGGAFFLLFPAAETVDAQPPMATHTKRLMAVRFMIPRR